MRARADEGGQRGVDEHDEKAHPVAACNVRDLDERQVEVLGMTEVFPGEPREQRRLRILENRPEKRSGRDTRNPAIPEKGNPRGEEPRVEAQVKGQQQHHGDPQRPGEPPVVHDDVGDPVQQSRVLHETGEQPREKGGQDGQRAQGGQQRDQGHPGNGPVTELREREHQEDPCQGGRSGPCRRKPPQGRPRESRRG